MMKYATTLIALASAAAAAPAHQARAAQSTCEQYGTVAQGGYQLMNNLWGKSESPFGQQCSQFTGVNPSASGNATQSSWTTSWTWGGSKTQVKSYASMNSTYPPTQLNSISSIPTTWTWKYAGTDGMVADVAYDMFTSSGKETTTKYEIMVWMAAYGGAEPISDAGKPIDSPTIGGHKWDLYSGVGSPPTHTYSFKPSGTIPHFSGDLMDFLNYLIQNEHLDGSEYLHSPGAGTEAFVGNNCTFTTTSYSLSMS